MSTSLAKKERPILFSAPMVRAILAGRKTQTRRVVSRLSKFGEVTQFGRSETPGYDYTFRDKRALWNDLNWNELLNCCPYGRTGDRLWVRETWTPDHAAFYPHFPYVYRADAGYEYERNEKGETYSPEQKAWFPYRWRPSIHMPRAASRITLEIKSVGVERLQSISKVDARREGMERVGYSENAIEEPGGPTLVDVQCWRNYEDPAHPFCSVLPERSFQSLWNVINGPASWNANPWVWVVEFERVTS
jgi:hypothetical protein